MTFEQLDEFARDVKSLSKKYRSIPDDLKVIQKILAAFPDSREPFSFRINDLNIQTCLIKVKKMACQSLKGRGVQSGLRLVYAHFPDENKIVLVELYFKGVSEVEDRRRILKYFK
jgi:mRNA-degrading endonuclease YafQ of YafQ-DinJ toxin-antitoxin module